MLRYFADGSTDFTDKIADFGNPNGGDFRSYGAAVALLSDQTIIEVGYFGFLIAKYKTDGYLDSSYGTNGKIVTDVDGDANAIAVEPNDEIVCSRKFRGLWARYYCRCCCS